VDLLREMVAAYGRTGDGRSVPSSRWLPSATSIAVSTRRLDEKVNPTLVPRDAKGKASKQPKERSA
jgi:hypothetical protein